MPVPRLLSRCTLTPIKIVGVRLVSNAPFREVDPGATNVSVRLLYLIDDYLRSAASRRVIG